MDNLAADTLSADNYYSDDVSTLGERISVAREHAGLTLNDLAKALAVQSDTLRGWEVDTAEPRANKLSMMAGVLGVWKVILILMSARYAANCLVSCEKRKGRANFSIAVLNGSWTRSPHSIDKLGD